MLDYNLTQRERQILIRLVALSRPVNGQFDARMLDSAGTGPSRELARIEFGAADAAGSETRSIELTKRDLRLLKDEGFIHFHWNVSHEGTGRLTGRALAAVGSNFRASRVRPRWGISRWEPTPTVPLLMFCDRAHPRRPSGGCSIWG